MRFDFAKTFVSVVLSAALSGCGGSSTFESSDIPAYRAIEHVAGAPSALSMAIDATVLIAYPGGSGTGFWISGDGVLVTNNHVLGAENSERTRCAAEGCFVNLFFHYQRGSKYTRSNYFLTPIRASWTLDVAAYQVWTNNSKSEKLGTSSYLSLAHSISPEPGLSVHAIGHPASGLKRRSLGKVFEVQESWFKSDTFSLPGNSGSPMVDTKGRLVGILRRSSRGHGHLRAKDIRVFTIATSAKAIAGMLDGDGSVRTTPFSNVNDVRTVDSAAEMSDLYLLAKQKTVRMGGEKTLPILAVLAKRCDAALAAPLRGLDEFDKDYLACYDSLSWINCRDPKDGTEYKSCPVGQEKIDWQTRFDKLAERAVEVHYNDPFQTAINPLFFEEDDADKERVHRQRLDAFLRRHKPKLSPVLSLYLVDASVTESEWNFYDGQNIVSYVKNFQKIPNYTQDYEYLIRSVLMLYRGKRLGDGAANDTTFDRITRTMLSDPKLPLDDRHLLEEELYIEGR